MPDMDETESALIEVATADSKMTMDLYAQLEQRIERRHATAFDALIDKAPRSAGQPRSGRVRDT